MCDLKKKSKVNIASDGFCRKLFAGFEANSLTGRNRHFAARARIASDAAFARLNDKNAESAQLDATTGGESLLHCLEQRIDDLFSLLLWHAGAVGDHVDYVQFDHFSSKKGMNGRE